MNLQLQWAFILCITNDTLNLKYNFASIMRQKQWKSFTKEYHQIVRTNEGKRNPFKTLRIQLVSQNALLTTRSLDVALSTPLWTTWIMGLDRYNDVKKPFHSYLYLKSHRPSVSPSFFFTLSCRSDLCVPTAHVDHRFTLTIHCRCIRIYVLNV